ncbi:MAG: DUF1329 domain-containing protein, partial [Phycisphaerales bacterium]|nr:DUF1329 domain-containing protein [Phycisphaerales bacterium]
MQGTQIGFSGLAAGLLLAASVHANEVDDSFHPYRNGFPTYPGLEPGMTIDKSNVAQFKEILDDATYRYIDNGWYQFPVIPTAEFPLHPGYIEASRANPGKVQLDENGLLVNSTAGRAFPKEPDPNDPQAGQKLVWSYQYGFNSG